MTNTSERIVGLHTPAPWVATKDPDGCADDWMIGVPDGKPDLVAVCNKRDAALIAAAPELLEALQDLTQYMVWQMYGDCREVCRN